MSSHRELKMNATCHPATNVLIRVEKVPKMFVLHLIAVWIHLDCIDHLRAPYRKRFPRFKYSMKGFDFKAFGAALPFDGGGLL